MAREIKILIVAVNPDDADLSALIESARRTVGRHTARRDQPHFAGGEVHGHCELPGGTEVSWTISGKRLHPSKFPPVIPSDARKAVAQVLDVDPKILEDFVVDSVSDEVDDFVENLTEESRGIDLFGLPRRRQR